MSQRSERQTTGAPSRLRWSDLILTLVVCSAPVLGLMARNPIGLPHVERLILLAVALWLLVVGAAAVALRLGAPREAVLLTSIAAVLLLTEGDGLIDRFGYRLSLLLIGIGLGVIALLAFRLRESPFPWILIYVLVVALGAGPIIQVYHTWSVFGTSHAVETTSLEITLGDARPDIWLIVLDGHPGLESIRQDMGAAAARSLEEDLSQAGYVTYASAWSSYWTTAFAIPSLFQMDYPAQQPNRNNATTREMYGIIAGENRLVAALESNGYATRMVESGWSGSSCGAAYDDCIASPWLDESVFLLAQDSIMNELILANLGYAFNVGSQHSMEWALENAGPLSGNERPDFVFAHVMAPHPPFYLNSDCESDLRDARSGVTFQRPGVSEETREGYFKEQMECLRVFAREIADRVGEESVIVLVSDHGTDRRRQLIRPANTWENEDIIERMNILVAIRGLDDCQLVEPAVLPNVMAHVLSCLSPDQVVPVEPRLYLGEIERLSADDFSQLLAQVP